MKIIDRVKNIFALSGLSLTDLWQQGEPIPHAMAITTDSAMRVSAVMACVRILAESVASLPLYLYRRTENGGKEPAYDHPLFRLVHDQPNSRQTSFHWREMLESHLALRGNALCEKIIKNGKLTQLKPLHPDFDYDIIDDVVIYTVRDGDFVYKIPQDRVLHISGLCTDVDGVKGLSPVEYAKLSIGLARKAEVYGEDIYRNGGTQRVALVSPGRIDERQQKLIRESWDTMYSGNAKTAVLHSGLDAKVIGMSAKDAQFLEARKFQIAEIARIYRVPLHMVGELDKATFSNIEHQSQEFITFTLRPWLVRWEQSLNRDLLSPSERKDYLFEFKIDGFMRADAQARAEYYTRALGNTNNGQPGWLNQNEIRALENMNPIDGGDKYNMPMEITDDQENATESRLVSDKESGR